MKLPPHLGGLVLGLGNLRTRGPLLPGFSAVRQVGWVLSAVSVVKYITSPSNKVASFSPRKQSPRRLLSFLIYSAFQQLCAYFERRGHFRKLLSGTEWFSILFPVTLSSFSYFWRSVQGRSWGGLDPWLPCGALLEAVKATSGPLRPQMPAMLSAGTPARKATGISPPLGLKSHSLPLRSQTHPLPGLIWASVNRLEEKEAWCVCLYIGIPPERLQAADYTSWRLCSTGREVSLW